MVVGEMLLVGEGDGVVAEGVKLIFGGVVGVTTIVLPKKPPLYKRNAMIIIRITTIIINVCRDMDLSYQAPLGFLSGGSSN